MNFLILSLIVVATLSGFNQAPSPTEPPKFDLDQYQFGMLERGPNSTTENTPEVQKIQEGHMANIKKMAEAGKLMAAGPMAENGDLRGIFIFKASSLEEAEMMAAQDPAIKAGRLKLRLINWWAPKGIGAHIQAELKADSDPKYTMTRYFLAFLRKGPKWTAVSSPELQKLQLAHLWDIRHKLDSGKYVSAGPLESKDDRAGIFVIAAESEEQAKAIAESDPTVKAGRYVIELHTWLVAKEVWP